MKQLSTSLLSALLLLTILWSCDSGTSPDEVVVGKISLEISEPKATFQAGEQQTFNLKKKGIQQITFTKPDGWKVAIEGETLTVTAPARTETKAELSGTVDLIGVGRNNVCMAQLAVTVEFHSHTITFEGEAWKQYVVANYHPEASCTYDMIEKKEYTWTDQETQLTTIRPEGSGYPFFVDSYNSNSLEDPYGSWKGDFYVYNPKGQEKSTTGGGNNGSDNFLLSFGNLDFKHPEYGDRRPILTFADKKPRIIKSLYLTSNCYFYNVATNGNALSGNATEPVTYYATGYDAEGNEVKTITITYATEGKVPSAWFEWDLSELGPIVTLRLNQSGGADNGYGYSLPANYAIDDITVEW